VLTFTGSSDRQLMGDGLLDAVHPGDLERFTSSVLNAVEAQRVFEIEVRLRRSDGEFRSMFTTGTPRFSGSTYVGHIAITVDITELKRKQEYVMAMQKLESLGVLAAGIAHDFNNLLGGILASAELVLAACAEGSPPDEAALSRIKTSAIRGGEIVRQLMIYSGEEGQSFTSVDVSRLVNEMLELLKVSISKRATLKVNLSGELPAVRANAAQLRQVVLNLITNASEALGEHEGVISVTAVLVRVGRDYVMPNLAQGDYIRLEVSDSGCGMTEEIQARIFDPFFTSKFAGRGLGLASVRGIVRSHGGAIHVASAPGKGSRFEVLLPCSGEPARERRGADISMAAANGAGVIGTVLVIEDEEPLRLAVVKMLRIQGFIAIEAANGRAGVDLFRQGAADIDVVFLDLTLPGMSGREVFDELRRIKPGARVVITSAYSQSWAEANLGGLQDWLYIRKPYPLSELTALLRKVCLERHGAGHAAGQGEPM
jgi:PAS domain S-box-containing protein